MKLMEHCCLNVVTSVVLVTCTVSIAYTSNEHKLKFESACSFSTNILLLSMAYTAHIMPPNHLFHPMFSSLKPCILDLP